MKRSMKIVALLFAAVAGAEQLRGEAVSVKLNSKLKLSANRKAKVPGMVDAMYTFGAPAASASDTPLPNLQNPNGNYFEGLRTYTENNLPGGGLLVDAAAKFVDHPHARIATLALDYNKDSFYIPGGGNPAWPSSGAVSWDLHFNNHYFPRLEGVRLNGKSVANQEPFATANKMAALAFEAYNTSVGVVIETMKKKLPGWILVDRRVHESGISGRGLYDPDHVLLAQETASLDCALVFTGTNTFGELFTSAKTKGTNWCGFPNVHAGYAGEVKSLTSGVLWSAIKPKLSKCKRVIVTGHSLGGAMTDVFSACANSGHSDNDEYNQLIWYKETPELMPALEEGLHLKNTLGFVSELYTYGSPAVSKSSLANSLSQDGCFQGLRVFTEDSSWGSTSIDAEVKNQNYHFVQMNSNVLALHWNSDSYFKPCNTQETTEWPKSGFENWGLHSERNYEDRLAALVQKHPNNDLYVKSKKFAALAFSTNKPLVDVQMIMSRTLQNWNLVERVRLGGDDRELTLLAQNTGSLECVLVLPGSKAQRMKWTETTFCGLNGVHAGYRNELNNFLQSTNWVKITDKLSKCQSVTCAGHGMGGSLCKLFAACANSQNQVDQDFLRLRWTKGTPQAMPSVEGGGLVLGEEGEEGLALGEEGEEEGEEEEGEEEGEEDEE